MELDLKSSHSIVVRKHLIKQTEEAIESFLLDDCAKNLKLIGALEEISFRLFAESNDVFISEAFDSTDENEFHWDDEFMFTSFSDKIEDDSGLPDENEWLTESIEESKPSISLTENSDADCFVKRSPLMMRLTVSPGPIKMTSSTAKFNCHEKAGMEFMLESDEIWILDSCDQESDENISFFTTPSITKSTRDSKLHEYSWKITGLKSDKCRMPMTFSRSHLRKIPFPSIHSASKKKGLMSPGRGKHQEDHRARQEASKDGYDEKKSRKNVVRRLFANECGFDYHSGSNKLEDLMLEEDINSAPTARAHQYTRSYQNEEEESYRGPFYQAEKKIRHTETKESPGDDQNWLVISTEEEEGLICSRNFELSDDYWILISHNEDNVATHKYRLYYYHEVDKMPLCHQDDLPDSPVSTCGRNVSVTNSSYNSTSIRLAEPFTERRASSTKMPTKVISQATQMESGPRSRLPSLSFYYESEYDDWIIITGEETWSLHK